MVLNVIQFLVILALVKVLVFNSVSLKVDFNDTTKVFDEGAEISLEGRESKPVILLIHGFTGATETISYLAKKLNQAGFSVFAPRLPGHGTNVGDFTETYARDWKRKVMDSYLDLKHRYKNKTIYVAGLSMGGVLALDLASYVDIDRVALYAPALNVKNKFIVLTNYLRGFIPPLRDKRPMDNSKPLDEYSHYLYPVQGGELYNLIKETKKRINLVRFKKMLIILTEKDESINLDSGDYIEKHLKNIGNIKRVELKNSSHELTNDVDKAFVADETIKFFS